MSSSYVDAHCHVQFSDYEEDRSALLHAMRDQNVRGIVVGVDEASSREAIVLAEAHEHLFASVGLHPNREASTVFEREVYRSLANHGKVVAIGECGLDYFRPTTLDENVKRAQQQLFREHIQLAQELDKPLIIHARPSKGTQDAYHDVIAILTEAKQHYPALRGDIHFFVGGEGEAHALIALGFTLSFTAVITFARDYDSVIRSVPLSSLLSETDAPYVAPAGRRGSRNDPLAVVEVVKALAEIRGEEVDTVTRTVAENAHRLFALP